VIYKRPFNFDLRDFFTPFIILYHPKRKILLYKNFEQSAKKIFRGNYAKKYFYLGNYKSQLVKILNSINIELRKQCINIYFIKYASWKMYAFYECRRGIVDMNKNRGKK